jgi:hypothetical protein
MKQDEQKEVPLKFFKSAIQADLVSGILKAEGVPNIVRRQGMEVRIGYPDYDGAEIFVLEESLEKAKEILESYTNEV